MIRVLNILETIGSGGVERRRLSMAKHLDKSKFELKIICTFTKGNIANEIRENGVEVIEIGKLKSPFDYKQHRKVQQIIEDFKPHIIHGAVFEGVTMAAVNGYLKKVPVVIIEETSDPKNRSWKGNLLMKLFAFVSHKVVGVSPATTAYLRDNLKLAATKVELITNGVAIPRVVLEAESKALMSELGLNQNHIIIGSVGRMLMDSNKRFSDLIKAFKNVAVSVPNARLVLVGEGPERVNYERLAKELQISDKVIFAGYQSDVAKYYALFDIFCLTSAHESFGLVLAEAMLHKLPVVATRVGGMQYIVDDAQTGYLVELFNIDEIAAQLTELCQNEPLRLQMGEAGFHKARREFTEERYVQNIEKLYFALLNK